MNGKTPEEMLKEMEAEEMKAEKKEMERTKGKCKGRGKGEGKGKLAKSKGRHLTNESCPSCRTVFTYASTLRKHIALKTCSTKFKHYSTKQKEFEFEFEQMSAWISFRTRADTSQSCSRRVDLEAFQV